MPEVEYTRLRRVFDPQELHFETTADIEPIAEIVGQDRAVRALEFGLKIDEEGYNVFVSGPAGTGKNTAIRTFIERYAGTLPTPDDWCYVYNFADSYRPRAIALPPGQGRRFQEDMERFVTSARRQIAEAFESDEYARRRAALRSRLDEERRRSIARVEEAAARVGFSLRTTQVGLFFVPMVGGRPADEQEIAALSPEERERLRRIHSQLEEHLAEAMKEIRRAEARMSEALRRLDAEVTRFAVGGLLEDLRERYAGLPEVLAYLDDVERDVIESATFLRAAASEAQGADGATPGQPDLLRRYSVNVIVDNGQLRGAPVVFEANPSYTHLFGLIEREAHMGTLYTDFTLIKGGTIHQAAGGFLVLSADELLRHPQSWEALKRALRQRAVELEEPVERAGVPTTKSLRPLPIPLKVKVILMGTPQIYHLLRLGDPEFAEHFKVKAEFDTVMDRTPAGIDAYVRLVGMLCEHERLCNLDRTAVAKIIEHGSRLAEHQEKLSTKFSQVADVLREASYWASQEGSDRVSAAHVRRSLEERRRRHNLLEERLQELMREGTIRVETTGSVVGQVNGLSVISLGDYAFGRPSRITCTVSLGQAGVIDIEREVKLGGPIHSKGVLILAGYLHERFGQEVPLSLSARLVFEQSYGGVDGDSASCAELCALLSRLASVPVRQELAISGAVDQKGTVLAVGGLNEKIEGFFDLCRARGLTGTQGVIIPESNIKNLMLREDVVEAVRAGEFHVYAVSRVEEALTYLTGREAGERGEDGTYPPGTVMHAVQQELAAMARRLRQHNRGSSQRDAEGMAS